VLEGILWTAVPNSGSVSCILCCCCRACVALVHTVTHCQHTWTHCPQSSGTKWSAAIETQLCYEIKTFLLAGHETSAAMLMWSVYELGRNSQARQQVRSSDFC
jgi:hypothetical protein